MEQGPPASPEPGMPAQPGGPGEKLPARPERAPAGAERAPVSAPRASAATPALPAPSQPARPAGSAADDVSATTPVANPPVQDDDDLIERSWVEKAKRIVERTRDDPYKQSEELTLFKADYMKKRYGKTIKISQ